MGYIMLCFVTKGPQEQDYSQNHVLPSIQAYILILAVACSNLTVSLSSPKAFKSILVVTLNWP